MTDERARTRRYIDHTQGGIVVDVNLDTGTVTEVAASLHGQELMIEFGRAEREYDALKPETRQHLARAAAALDAYIAQLEARASGVPALLPPRPSNPIDNSA